QNPGMTGEVRERLQAALKSRKPEGVRLEQVAEALRALERRDVATARRLLAMAIMPAGMPMPAPGPGGSVPPRPQGRVGLPRTAPGLGSVPVPPPAAPESQQQASPVAPTGRQQAQPASVVAAMQMSEPLRARFGGSTVEILFLAAGIGLVGLGLFLLRPGKEGGR
ncbi:MAG: hypothetical protein RB148_08025, partial [Armatimonadota bacterium]|nr:hypothetical protein [Armatimonadota bacterium]